MKRFLYRLFRFLYVFEQWRLRRVTTSGMVVGFCLVLSGTLGLDTNQSMAYQIFTFLLSILLIAIGFSFFLRTRFRFQRLLPRFATVGTPLKYRVVIQNLSRHPQAGLSLFENFADPRPGFWDFLQTPEPEEVQRNSVDRAFGYYRWLWLIARKQRAKVRVLNFPIVPPRGQAEVVIELIPLYRGVVRFTGLTLSRSDPFGLFNACVSAALPQSLLILPRLYTLPPVELPGLRRYQSGGISLASSVGDSEEFMSLREYRLGDPPRKIHWKSWAKLGKPIVREEQDEFFVRHALILDTFQAQPYSQVLEEAVSVAASFACEIRTQESLLDLMFVGLETYCFTFGRGLSHTDKMLEILASVAACSDKSFDSLIPAVMNRLDLLSGCICVLLTWDEQRQALVKALQVMRIPMLVLVMNDGEEQPSNSLQDGLTEVRFLKLGQIQEGLLTI